jgi:hypothetical protein
MINAKSMLQIVFGAYKYTEYISSHLSYLLRRTGSDKTSYACWICLKRCSANSFRSPVRTGFIHYTNIRFMHKRLTISVRMPCKCCFMVCPLYLIFAWEVISLKPENLVVLIIVQSPSPIQAHRSFRHE